MELIVQIKSDGGVESSVRDVIAEFGLDMTRQADIGPLAHYYTISNVNRTDAEQLRERLQSCQGVTAAFLKVAAELP